MNLTTKIVTTLAVAGITATAIVAPDISCVDRNGITFMPAEELTLQKSVNQWKVKDYKLHYDKVTVNVGKVCFKDEKDYQKAKNDKFSEYKNSSDKEKLNIVISDKGVVLAAIINNEIKKLGGSITFEMKKGEDIVFKHIETIEKSNK